jgi:uncharacterized protein YjiS (DUF1127 family)
MLKVINSVIKYIAMRNAYNRTYRELSKLSDYELSDIGMSRYDIAQIAQESATGIVVEKKNTTDILSALKTLFNARLALR